MNRGGILSKPVYIVNFEIKDNQEDAAIGARAMLQLVDMLLASDWESQFEDIMEAFQQKCSIQTLHTVCFY
jgi:RNA polymerase II subunit A C-terminal domain phosphatase SSU72